MIKTRTFRWTAACSTVVIAVAVTAAGATSYGATSSADPAPTPDSATTTAVPVVQKDISSHFKLFRNQLPAAMPKEVEQAIASSTKYGRNAALARSIKTPYGTGWVIPGDGYLCLAVPDPLVEGFGTTCQTTAEAIQHGVWARLVGDNPGAEALDTLLVPDDKTTKQQADSSVNGVASRLQHESDERLIAKSSG